jgi:hypothetical protein
MSVLTYYTGTVHGAKSTLPIDNNNIVKISRKNATNPSFIVSYDNTLSGDRSSARKQATTAWSND